VTETDERRLPVWVDRLALVRALSQKNFQVRYKAATLGVLWAILQPTFQAAVLTVVFTEVFRVGGSVPHYPVYVISGILPWAFFTQSLVAATTAVADNGSLVRKVAIPLAVFPMAAIGGVGIAFAASRLVLVIATVIAGTVSLHLLLLPVAVGLELLVIASIGFLTAAFHVAFRDIRYVIESLLLVGLYATPILYTASRVPAAARPYLDVNPMTGVLSVYRAAVLGMPINGRAVLVSSVGGLLLLALSLRIFVRRSGEFADLV
jgi:ABC-type polysaccharide/polyol phosphate export permease